MVSAKNLSAVSTGRRAVSIPEPINGSFREVELSEQVEDIWKGPGWQAGRNSKTLIKHPDLRVVLTAVKARAYLHEHRAAGSISVQTLKGHIRMHIPGRTFDLPAGRMLMLEEAVPHDVEALKDSAYLLTIAWHGALGDRVTPGLTRENRAHSQLPQLRLSAETIKTASAQTASESHPDGLAGARNAAA